MPVNNRPAQSHLKGGFVLSGAITREIRDLMDAVHLGLRMLGGLGQVATTAGATYTAGYMLMHGGQPPAK